MSRLNYNKLGAPVGKDSPPEMLEYLKARGVPLKIARAANLRVLTAKQTAEIWRGCKYPALLGPFAPDYGAARLFDAPANVDKWRSTGGESPRLYEPPLALECRRAPEQELLLIEGPIKVLAAIAHGRPAIGITGCWNWQRQRQPLPQLRRYRWAGRVVVPVFDADITENDNVAIPYLLFGDWLQSQGARVRHVAIPPLKGNRRAGFDDFVAANGIEAFDELPRKKWDGPAVERLRTSVMRTTEGGLSSIFVMRYLDDVRYDPVEEDWYWWTGARFRRQPRKAADIQETMKETIQSLIADANLVKNADRRKRMLQWAIRCDNRRTVRDATELASSDPRIRAAHEDFDTNEFLLGCKNGVLDLRKRTLLRGSRDQLVTQSVAVAYDPEAKCKRWRKFVRQIMCGDAELIDFLQRLAGYLLVGGNPDRLVFFLYGVGRNGKSVFIETLRKLMGSYAIAAKSELIMRGGAMRDSESAQPFMLKLRGKRYITAAEVAEGMTLDAAVVKTLTGNDQMTVRGLHQEPVEFTIIGKIVVRCNHRPIIEGGDQAIWDRVVEIPFELRLKDDEQDKTLARKLEAELPGILNWALNGYDAVQRSAALVLPKKVQHQTARYRAAMDSVANWLDENTITDFSAHTAAGALYMDYEQFCRDASTKNQTMIVPRSLDELGRRLLDRQYVKKRHKQGVQWYGIRIRKESDR